MRKSRVVLFSITAAAVLAAVAAVTQEIATFAIRAGR